jgi:hypothetical protein
VRIVTFSSEDTGGCSVASVGNVFVGRPANAPKGGQSVFKKKSFTMPTDASLIENLRSDRLRTNGILGAFRDVRAKSAWGRYCRKSLFRVKPEKSSGRTGLVAFFGRRGNWNLTGQTRALAAPPDQVGHRVVNRPSGSVVGHPSDSRPTNVPGRTHTMCQLRSLIGFNLIAPGIRISQKIVESRQALAGLYRA